MQVSDPYVLRVIINSAGIESTYVARTRAELDNILLSTGRGGFGWSADLYTVRRFPLVSSPCFRGMRADLKVHTERAVVHRALSRHYGVVTRGTNSSQVEMLQAKGGGCIMC